METKPCRALASGTPPPPTQTEVWPCSWPSNVNNIPWGQWWELWPPECLPGGASGNWTKSPSLRQWSHPETCLKPPKLCTRLPWAGNRPWANLCWHTCEGLSVCLAGRAPSRNLTESQDHPPPTLHLTSRRWTSGEIFFPLTGIVVSSF